ncbi:hypothetical protein DICPUDRAFT_150244 [Dictyostelium purpureum]|uniref:BTB domain-containing protein n=1 Tax=Dictyostelium purpureum TaxID=5786 RepID=F0ZFU2_DICPU|nr:uncharacterized protein DICPUDRAFT_150244 [Dictyostelium purpureum]EGC37170.1 hypothetical protein DICPUDRAFT_150244 [Dictyostelium purpureum]|eukprot:XP_003286298.1 hypothetical protein DICPUDRAFT_150244 [Dictyostelium purpureum]
MNEINNGDFIVINNNRMEESEFVKLNVGGSVIYTTLTTLRKEKDSMLGLMFKKDSTWKHAKDENGCILIDADPRYFLVILNFLRHGEIIIEPNLNYYGVLSLARYFGLNSLTDLIDNEDDNKNSWTSLMEENFLTSEIDHNKWAVTREAGSSNFSLEEGRFKFINRVYLVSKDQFNPEDGEIRITGIWTKETPDDFFQICTRSDGKSQGSPYFEAKSGVEFHYSRGQAAIIGRGGLVPSGVVKIKKQGEFFFGVGVPVHFEIFDDGCTVSFSLWENTHNTSIEVETTCTNKNLINYIIIHNREKTSTTNQASWLSNIKVSRWNKSTPRRNRYRRVHEKKMNLNTSI